MPALNSGDNSMNLGSLEEKQRADLAKINETNFLDDKLTPQECVILLTALKLGSSRIDHLKKMEKYKEQRNEIHDYNKALELINNLSNSEGLKIEAVEEKADGKVDQTNLYNVLQELQTKYPDTKFNLKNEYSSPECMKLIENLKSALNAVTQDSNWTMEEINHCFNERLEMHSYSRNVTKACHDVGTQMARNIKG